MAQKRYYSSLKEAKTAKAESRFDVHIFKVKQGRHKGQYFVGSQLEWFSL